MSEKPLSIEMRTWGSLALLFVAVAIGWMNYETKGWFFTSSRNLRPDLVSTLLAIGFAGALYVRGLLVFRGRLYCILMLILNITVTATLMQALLGSTAIWITRLPMPYLLAFTLLLTWGGLREVAIVTWAATLLFGLVNLGSANAAMGFYGYVFVLCVGVAVILQATDTLMREPTLTGFGTAKGRPVLPRRADSMRTPRAHTK